VLVSISTKLWMAIKGVRSRSKAKSVNKNALPALPDITSIASYVTQKLTYTGDPVLGGLDDYYNHPGYLQYCIENKLQPPVDCDDYSVLAYALAKQLPNAKPQMLVFVIPSLRTILGVALKALSRFKVPYFPFHEGCLIELDSKLWFIDTNGLWELNSPQDVIDAFQKAWGLPFTIIPTEYPFKEI
jgi:hypothetical protein